MAISERARLRLSDAATCARIAAERVSDCQAALDGARSELRSAPQDDEALIAVLRGFVHLAEIDLANQSAKARLYDEIAKGGKVG